MAAPDMDVIKEIPGYKVILKAVLKSQIQQLVEQLASHTDEESVILTASVSDGTLSHLGSDSGKFFLQDHEDIKSQFLGFCLKRHHKRKQEKDREEELKKMSFSPAPYGPRQARFPPPRQGIHPVSLTRASRPSGVRHEPYILPRPRRSTDMNPVNQMPSSPKVSTNTPSNNQIIKLEPHDEGSNQSVGDAVQPSTSQPTSPSLAQTSTEHQDNSSNEPSDLPTDSQPPGGLGLDSDLSNLISGEGSVDPTLTSTPTTSDIDPDVSVKLEAISEGDMELEITGVEPGRASVSSQDTSWGPDTSMGYDPSGATGSQADLQGQESFNGEEAEMIDRKGSQRTRVVLGFDTVGDRVCVYCDKVFFNKTNLRRHMRIHDGVFPYSCKICGRKFTDGSNYRKHQLVHLQGKLLSDLQ